MAKGLHDLINVIRKDPVNKVLVHRFLVLVGETPDGEEKIRLLLELAHAIRGTIPFDALRMAHIVFQKVWDHPDYRAQNFDVAALGVVVSALKELGRFAKANMVEMELEKLIESKKNNAPARRFTQKGVNRVVKEFTEEVSKLNGGPKEDSLGNILTQLARGKDAPQKQNFKLPDLDLFGKGEGPEGRDDARPAPPSRGAPTILVVDDDVTMDEALPFAGNLLEKPNADKRHPSVAQEHFHLPEKAQRRAEPQAPTFIAGDGEAPPLDFAASAPAPNAESEAPVFDLGEGASTPAPADAAPSFAASRPEEASVFALSLEGTEAPVLIKRTPVVKDESHTMLAPLPRLDLDVGAADAAAPAPQADAPPPSNLEREVQQRLHAADPAPAPAPAREAGAGTPAAARAQRPKPQLRSERARPARESPRPARENHAPAAPQAAAPAAPEGRDGRYRLEDMRDLLGIFESYLRKGFLAETKDMMRGMIAEQFTGPRGMPPGHVPTPAPVAAPEGHFRRTPVTSLNDAIPKNEGLSEAFWENLVGHLGGQARQPEALPESLGSLLRGRVERWAEKLRAPLTPEAARELTGALAACVTRDDEDARRALAAALWRWLGGAGVAALLEGLGLGAFAPAFAWCYVDALISRRQFRRAWHVARGLTQGDCRLPQARQAYDRLRVIYPRLGFQSFAWREEEGVEALQRRANQRPLPTVGFHWC